MRKCPLTGVFVLLFLFAGGIARTHNATITTLQIFPSPQEILRKAGNLPRWKASGSPTQSGDLTSLPTGMPFPLAVLKECGIRSVWQASYTRGKETAQVQVLELGDTSGAFSLFSLLNQPIQQIQALGDRSVLSANDLWMWQVNLLVHVIDPKQSGKSKSRLLELGKEISRLIHQRAEIPNLVKQLPFHNQVPGSFRYVLGSRGLESLGIPVQTSSLRFEMGAEASTARYRLPSGEAQLLLISYPTPQMARKFFARIQEPSVVLKNPTPQDRIFSKRAGPLVAVLMEASDAAEAAKLLAAIQYSADLTWDEAPPRDAQEVRDYLRTIVRSIMLTGTLLLFTFGVGVLFGLLRLAVKLWVPFPIFDRPEDVELIQLRLWEKTRLPTKQIPSK
jgi:hypothetical protein